MLLGVGAVPTKPYIDDVFSTYVFKANGSTGQTINNGINLSGEGGLVWHKDRDATYNHVMWDTVRGDDVIIRSDTNAANSTVTNGITFNSNGYSVNTAQGNESTNDTVSWTFRKAPGFFDVVTFTETSGTLTVNHSLGCLPGMVLIKRLDGANDWWVWHKHDKSKIHRLNTNAAGQDMGTDAWLPVTSTTFDFIPGYIGAGDGSTWVAYLFAGGESAAATAKSVEMDGTGDYFTTSTSSDYTFGTGDFTVEHWINLTGSASNYPTVVDARTDGSYTNMFVTYMHTDSTYRFNKGSDKIASTPLARNTWNHIAVCRSSGVTTLYLNGTSQGTWADTTDYTNTSIVFGANAVNAGHTWEGKLSNLRIVKGTAVYTSSFKPPTVPLTNITNTKLLCFNDSSTTGATVGTITASGNPTASSDSPFDDPAGLVFGENEDQGVIKMGSYVGNGSTTGPEINLGWEPQYILWKNSSNSGNWLTSDSMRGISTGAADSRLDVNSNASEDDADNWLDVNPTGFQPQRNSSFINTDGNTYIYMAIRRPDSLVQKPASAGTDVFAMDTGSGNSTLPVFDSGFPVDWAWYKNTGSASSGILHAARLMEGKYLNSAGSATESTFSDFRFDSNLGWNQDSVTSSWQSWMWKRHAGFDVVTDTSAEWVSHNLGRVPEMVIIKHRSAAENWFAWHKDLNGGGSNSIGYWIYVNGNSAESNSGNVCPIGDTLPTATHFQSDSDGAVRHADCIAFLFASVDKISKVGSYTGSASDLTIDCGFQPRFVLIKSMTDAGYSWVILDSNRTWGSGNDNYLQLNSNSEEVSFEMGAPTSSGFTVDAGSAWVNGSTSRKYIYYAHA